MSLSVILITKNEEANIKDCLESVSFADEIIVVDSQSSDKTQEIAQSYGAKLEITSDWPGFGPQKNRALERGFFMGLAPISCRRSAACLVATACR